MRYEEDRIAARTDEAVTFDVIVVGGGPAGLSAGLWLARYRRRTLVLDSGEYRNRWVDRSHGYLGRDDCSPMELLADARKDLQAYPEVEIRRTRAVAARRDGEGGFVVETGDGEVAASRLILATGVGDRFPQVSGFFEHYGASAFHCPSCDGYEARDRRVVAIGWSEHMAEFALKLLDWAASVTVVTDGHSFEGEAAHREALGRHGIEIVEENAVALEGPRGDLRALVLSGGRQLDCDLLFFSLRHTFHTALAEQLGCSVSEEGCVCVDENGETDVRGVYAAGDLAPGPHLVQVAAAKGTIAAVHCAQSLHGEPGAPGSPEPAPDPAAELPAE